MSKNKKVTTIFVTLWIVILSKVCSLVDDFSKMLRGMTGAFWAPYRIPDIKHKMLICNF